MLFVTEAPAAAETLAELRYQYVLASTLDAVRQGLRGDAVNEGGSAPGKPGCWRVMHPVRGVVIDDAPVDLWTQTYARYEDNQEWRLPLDRPIGRARRYITMSGNRIYLD